MHMEIMFCEDFFFLWQKRDAENSELVCSMLRASIDGDVHIFPRDLSILGVMVGQLLLNSAEAHQNHLGRLLKIQNLGPHP